jgi:hypothetical protein
LIHELGFDLNNPILWNLYQLALSANPYKRTYYLDTDSIRKSNGSAYPDIGCAEPIEADALLYQMYLDSRDKQHCYTAVQISKLPFISYLALAFSTVPAADSVEIVAHDNLADLQDEWVCQ